jgi:hypothetical protein
MKPSFDWPCTRSYCRRRPLEADEFYIDVPSNSDIFWQLFGSELHVAIHFGEATRRSRECAHVSMGVPEDDMR